MAKVMISLDESWVARVRSPLYWLVAPFTGVSVTFAPMFLVVAGFGRWRFPLPLLIALAAMIVLPGWFYIRLAGPVVAQLYAIGKKSERAGDSAEWDKQ